MVKRMSEAFLNERMARSRTLDEMMLDGIPRGSTSSRDVDLPVD